MPAVYIPYFNKFSLFFDDDYEPDFILSGIPKHEPKSWQGYYPKMGSPHYCPPHVNPVDPCEHAILATQFIILVLHKMPHHL